MMERWWFGQRHKLRWLVKKLEDIMIGGTRLGNPVEVMNAPGNEWTWIVWKFMVITVPTMIFLEWGWY